MTLAGIVLAAGASRRWGEEDKLLAPFRGSPLAAHAADAMRGAPVDLRIAVMRDPELAALFDGFELVRPEGEDQSASLHAGVRLARDRGAGAVLVALADMPLVNAPLLARVARLGFQTGTAAARDGELRAPPAYFPADTFQALLALTGDRGAGGLLRDLPDAAFVDAAGRLADIDRPGDLDRLEAGISATPRAR